MKVNYIPLGTRCTSAFVVRDNMGKREMSLPFDWLDLPITAIKKFLSIKPKDVEYVLTEYFEKLGDAHKHDDGTWFPHDIEFIDGTWKLKKDTKDKFIRRLNRFNDLLDKDECFVFLTSVLNNGMYKLEDYIELKTLLEHKSENIVFITINLGDDFINGNHFNFNIPQLKTVDEGLKKWEALIYETIINHVRLQKYVREISGDI